MAVAVHAVDPSLQQAAVGVVARGMRDNPLHVVAYGPDPARRVERHALLIGGLFATSPDLEISGAFQDGRLVAVSADAPPGTCGLVSPRRLRIAPVLVRLGPRTALRVVALTGTWARHHLTEPHVHLGPVAVDAGRQRQGLGTALLRHHCRRLDTTGRVGFLETDQEGNVAFYRRFGYEVVDTALVLGVRNWFMRRPARAT